MEIIYQPYIDPEYESLIERIYPPRICVDNDACKDSTLVKVDSANKHGILLEMVQVLTDLDLVISKSYISSDGGWFMDVFHVTDQLGNKITDESLILYIQKALCPSRREVRPGHVSTEQTVVEMTATDRPGLMSEMSAVLIELGCNVTSAVAWTHNTRVACILNVEDGFKGGPIRDPIRLSHVEQQLGNVVEAHHGKGGERSSVRLTAPVTGQTHKERRLHQLMCADKDYGWYHGCDGEYKGKCGDVSTHVSIETCKEKGYSVVNVRSRDRPKLLFDTVCALTDMQYVVFHAAVASKASMADQEYFIRHKDGCTLDTVGERHKLSQCLIAAIERRVSHGLRLEVSTRNRMGLLSDITRVLRENGLSISRVEVGTRGERAVGSFYINDASGHDHVNPNIVEAVKKESGGSVLAVPKSPEDAPTQAASSSRTNRSMNKSGTDHDRPRFSLGSLLWSQLERFSGNFGPIRS